MPKMSVHGWFIVGAIVAASSGCGFESPDASSAGEDTVPSLTRVEQNLLSGYYLPFKAGTARTCSRGACGNPSGGGHCVNTKYNNYSFDWVMPRGTPLYASKGGTVQKTSTACTSGMTCWNGGDAGCASGKENFVEIRIDGTNYVHAYGHMDRVAVKTGDVIKAGQYIGTSGMTGCAYGAHLHTGVRYQTSVTADWHTVEFGYVESSGVPQCGTGRLYTSQNSGTGTDEPSGSIWNQPRAAIEDARDGMITSRGKCLRRPGSAPGAIANIRSCTDSTGAEFTGVRFSLTDGKLIVTSGGLCLENIDNSNLIKSKDCTGNSEQRWTLYDMRFVNYTSNKCLDVAKVEYGATVRIWTCGASDSGKQVFDWRRGDGTIRPNADPDLCVRPKYGEATAGTVLFLGSCNGDPSVWIPQSKGFVNSAAPGLSWEVDGTSNGSVVRLQPTNGSWRQKFGARGTVTSYTGSCMTVSSYADGSEVINRTCANPIVEEQLWTLWLE